MTKATILTSRLRRLDFARAMRLLGLIEGVCHMAKTSKKKVRNQAKPSEDAVLRRKLKTEPKPQKGKKGKTAAQGAH